MPHVQTMFNAQLVNWDNGNFKIQTNKVYVPNLDDVRKRLSNRFVTIDAAVKTVFDSTYALFDEAHIKNAREKNEPVLGMEYFEMWRFNDVYSLKGNTLTLSGFTTLNPECMSRPFTMVSCYGLGSDVDAREFARYDGHSNFDRRFGIQGRFASASDPGYIHLMIEGRSDLEPTFINMNKITKIPNSPELIIAYDFK